MTGHSQSSRQSVMWLLGLLLLLFLLGMFLLSNLNLRYSQQALSDLRRQQISALVDSGLARIDARQSVLANYTITLANVGESYRDLLASAAPGQVSRIKEQLEASIRSHFEDFRRAAGAGLWFEPDAIPGSDGSYMPYFIRQVDKGPIKRMATQTRFGHYRDAPWYDRTLPSQTVKEGSEAPPVFWSPVYYDLNTDQVVLTLASPMHDHRGQFLGFATTAWGADQIIDLVSRITVTDNSFSFLNDSNNRNLSSLSQGEDTPEEQALIDAILALKLSGDGGANAPTRLQTRNLTVGGRQYELYYAATSGGMVYGAGVPRDEINAVLLPMERTNFRILAGTVAAMLVLSLYLLFRIIQLIRELQASYTDELTGLPNRVRLLRDLRSQAGASLLIINLDRFNQINSLFGNLCGDRVLLTLARRLMSLVEETAMNSARVYRLPGDEFAVLTPVMTVEELQHLAQQLRQKVTGERIDWQSQSLTVEISIGMARREARQKRGAADQLISQAKVAVLQAREQGRHFLTYDASVGVEENYENNLYWANRLKEAIDQNRLLPWFQPLHDNKTGRITKYECLVRMMEPDGSVISAGRFMDIANKLRLNRQIAALMIRKCFAFFADREESFSINLSSGDITEPETVSTILSVLESSDIGDRVIFEILESDGIVNYEDIRDFIKRVKPFGCRIAIDDFGTGYSNFAHLLSLKVDIIKIDGSLIRHLHEDQTAFLVTRGIVEFARSLNMETVAEFVHNEAVQARVCELGIDFSQGEYFSMPVPRPGHWEDGRFGTPG